MFPAQTSFIPVTVALVRFIESSGFSGLYPYWYFGTTPIKYLIGPVVPGILISLHKIVPDLTLFDLSLSLLIISLVLRSVGWGMLTWKLSNQSKIGVLVGVISFFAPWQWVSGLGLSEVSATLASAMTPWVLLAFARIFNFVPFSIEKQFTIFNLHSIFNIQFLMSVTAFALLLLTNSTAAFPAIVGMLILGFVLSKQWQSGVRKAVWVFLGGFILATVWYGPGYWLSILGAPSIGGKSLIETVVSLLNSLRYYVPVLLAIVIVKFGFRSKNLFEKFSFYWLTFFFCSTLFRFVSDPDFLMDWTNWMGEMEIGLALIFAGPASRFFPVSAHKTFVDVDIFKLVTVIKKKFLLRAVGNPSTTVTRSKLSILLTIFSIYLIVGWLLAFAKRDFWLPRKNIDNTVEYQVATWLNQNVKCQLSHVNCSTVFLSGTTAFWLNAFYDIRQVRGGRDEVAVDQSFRDLAWEVREGVDPEISRLSLLQKGVDYLVVHTDLSEEYYHDFRYPEKFDNINSLTRVYEKDGDVIYHDQKRAGF